MWILLFVTSLLAQQLVSGLNIEERLADCCRLGKTSAVEEKKCESVNPVPGVPPEQQSICLSAAHLCCVHQLREIECAEGKKAAKNGGNCPDKKTLDEKYCCESCKLGLISGSMGSTCFLGNVSFGLFWDSAFLSCCEDTKKFQFQVTQNPLVVHGSVGNVCQLLPGELCAHICVPTLNSYKCQCQQGFVLMADGKSCEQEDIPISKESCAQRNPCSHNCIDTTNGILCICNPGFLLNADNVTCNSINVTKRKIETCQRGYKYDETLSQCIDVDECEKDVHTCNRQTQSCLNVVGGFRCLPKDTARAQITCLPGFRYNEKFQTCVDINECTETEENPCDSNQRCENTRGSFKCYCRNGFQLDSITHACVDINECQVSLHNCLPSQRCDNTIGSFQCIRYTNCGTGYTLNSGTGQCEDDDECQLGTDNCRYLGDDYVCRNTQGSFRCERRTQMDVLPSTTPFTPVCRGTQCIRHLTCPLGYRTYGNRCIDINECEEGVICRSDQRCVNTPGSYTCTNILRCQPGFKLNDGKNQCIDIDECRDQQGVCSHNCINLWGNFMCTCRPGYTLNEDNRTCSDVNECEMYKDRRLCMGYCVNQLGSYTCQCPQGYKLGANGASCEDIDECSANPNLCREEDEVCIDMRGSYRCIPIICPSGYTKDRAQRNRCVREVTSCLEGDSVCQHQPLSYSFHYITLVSNLTIPNSGKIDLFSMRGPLWSSTTVDFSLELVQARAPQGIRSSVRSDFALTRTSHNQAGIALVRTLEGPQDIQLKLTMEYYHNSLFGGKTISNIEIYVSQYPF